MSMSGQKFVARNRAPRVQIEYDVELYGAEKKIQLPFVMGVMADLTGKSEEALPSVNDRKFLEIDVDNFDDRLKSLKPRAAFTVPNTLSGEGNLQVDITFESLEDFSPAAIAKKIEPLRKLLDARTQLSHLSTYMDGKTGAENLIAQLISDPAALRTFVATAAVAGPETGKPDATTVLADLRETAPADPGTDDQGQALDSLRSRPVPTTEEDTGTEDALAGLRARAEVASTDSGDERDPATDIISDLHKAGTELHSTETEQEIDLAAMLGAGGVEQTPDTGDDGQADILDSLRKRPIDTEETGADEAMVAGVLENLREATPAPTEKVSGEVTAEENDEIDPPSRLSDTSQDNIGEEAETDGDMQADADIDLEDLSQNDADDDPAVLTAGDEDTPSGSVAETDDTGDEIGGDIGNNIDLDALTADEDAPSEDSDAEASENDDIDLDALLTDDDEAEDEADDADADDAKDDAGDDIDLDALLADENDPSDVSEDKAQESDELDVDALLADDETGDDADDAEADDAEDDTGDDIDLDALLADEDVSSEDSKDEAEESDELDLDALLADDDETEDKVDDADETSADSDADDDDFSALFGDDDDTDVTPSDDEDQDAGDAAIDSPFGTLSAPHPEDRNQPRSKFRIALLGDFSGRANRGDLEIGDDLATRKALKFDIDNFEDVIARFATTLVLPIGKDGEGVEVRLGSIDDLHPDELYENVALFEELSVMRQRVARGDQAAIDDLKMSAAQAGEGAGPMRPRARGSTVPADRRLSDFSSLIGDMQGSLAQPSPAETLISSVVGPYVVAAADQQQEGLLAALDEALSGAMRTILHHPDFQAVESVWRSLEFLARRVETDASFEIVLYDVSAEEWAADLAAQQDLAESGLFRMLAEEPRLDAAQGPLSAVFGLYTLEETPPHAELLARMSKISEWMNAPFVTAISAQFLDTPKKDRHPLIARTWDELRALPEAAYVGLVSPRFLLRLPYGRKTEPVDPFEFEEFTLRSGLKGMLWANPVILSATLLAATAYKSGKSMRLGEIMSLGDIPVHTMTDTYGDQVALPCTERLLNTRTTEDVVSRGFMPVLSIKGRNEIRQGSFQALGADELHGPWDLTPGQGRAAFGTELDFQGVSHIPDKTQTGKKKSGKKNADDADPDDDTDDGDFDLDLDSGPGDSSDDDDSGLDDILAGFGDDDDSSDDDDEMDPDLAALLGDL